MDFNETLEKTILVNTNKNIRNITLLFFFDSNYLLNFSVLFV